MVKLVMVVVLFVLRVMQFEMVVVLVVILLVVAYKKNGIFVFTPLMKFAGFSKDLYN